ncbi:DUF29 domain-containing protein [Azospirillum lipoferum]|uniref:DUF29 domain-containing protein n=1 Tax=Azospirillum lipoferum (strain 4B) TaxID=862719 RepID=G7Z8D6_AZOL4|nr:DUF29 domain-containing protein [Azospirillum lipoferum]CBS85695.1 conserved protein of unknown function; putative coiled-coil domain [Azospirillum lipoferum 4B]
MRIIRGMSTPRPEPPAPAAKLASDTADNGLYDEDFVAWIERQTALLRSGSLTALDRANLAEELEDMGKAIRRALCSRLEVLLTHLLKYQFQPAMRTGSWLGTIDEQRNRIEDLVEESPSLRPLLAELLEDAKIYKRAVQKAALETGLPAGTFPLLNPYGGRALEDRFWPGPGPHPDLD